MDKLKTTVTKEMKELLSDPKNRIKLEDFVIKHLRMFQEATNIEYFPIDIPRIEKEEFLDRMKKYELIVKDLQQIVILLARWGEGEQLKTLEKVFSRIAELDKDLSSSNRWVKFRWYPIQILMYSAGIAALSARKYETLKIILTTLIQNSSRESTYLPIITLVSSNLVSDFHDFFKWIPGRETAFVPLSEHLFKLLELTLEELLFIGKSYERFFDDYEIYSALVHISITERDWGPIGRFGWKYRRDGGNSPFIRIVEEAKNEKGDWPPLKVGIFNGSLERFIEVSSILGQTLNKLNWF
jgi:hypothetical protein